MKTYDEYYKECKLYCDDSLSKSENRYGKGWWKKYNNNLDISQEFEIIKTNEEKNDFPIIKNNTNVNNSEWYVLHYMLTQMVIDYMNENNINDNVFSYSINISLDKPDHKWTIFLKKSDYESIILPESEPYDFPSYEFIGDEKIIRKFDKLNGKIYKYVNKFLKNNKKDIPSITNNINFFIDDIHSSKESDEWLASSDSSLSIGWDKNGDDNADELLVVSM